MKKLFLLMLVLMMAACSRTRNVDFATCRTTDNPMVFDCGTVPPEQDTPELHKKMNKPQVKIQQ